MNWGIAVIAFLTINLTACKEEAQLDPEPVVYKLQDRAQANKKFFLSRLRHLENLWLHGLRTGGYAFSLPCEINPLMDETGIHADKGQKGPVYFLVEIHAVFQPEK